MAWEEAWKTMVDKFAWVMISEMDITWFSFYLFHYIQIPPFQHKLRQAKIPATGFASSVSLAGSEILTVSGGAMEAE